MNLYLKLCKFSLFSSTLRKTAKLIHKIKNKAPCRHFHFLSYTTRNNAFNWKSCAVRILGVIFSNNEHILEQPAAAQPFLLKGLPLSTLTPLFFACPSIRSSTDSHKCTDSPAAPPQMSRGSGENKNTAVKSA